MKRHTITEGATTTAGGKVVSASSHGYINGARIALENDPVSCPTCGATGRIVCVGARLPENWNGIQVALENDLCVCKCYPHPRLIPSQTMRYQIVSDYSGFDGSSEGYSAVSGSGAQSSTRSESAAFDQHFELKDEAGRSLADFPYLIELSNGRRVQGRTDQDGKTAKVAASCAEHATLIVYAREAAPLNPRWDR